MSDYLRGRGVVRGTSVPNIALFCKNNNIHKYDHARLSAQEMAEQTTDVVQQVGPTYGRKMITGM